MIIATAGHVDHGKTLLVHTLSGVDTDTLIAEKERGLTIDLGFAYANFGQERIGFVDVPGHIRFIANMLAGVSSVDAALIVIAADDGPMPQTLEHLAILDLLGIRRGIVALTKIDLVDEVRVQGVTTQIENLLAGTSLEGSPILPVSSASGSGIEDLKQGLVQLARNIKRPVASGHFRMAVDRCFVVKGAGVVVTGSVSSGRIAVGDEVVLLPQDIKVRVRRIHRQNESATEGEAGDRCALNIAGQDLDRNAISRGNWIAGQHIPASYRMDLLVRSLPGQRSVNHFAPVHVHAAASHTTGRIALLESNVLAPGDEALVQLVMNDAITLWSGDRVIIRDQSARFTIAGGTVIDPFAPRKHRQSGQRLAMLKARLLPTTTERLSASLQVAPVSFDFDTFARAENLTLARRDSLLSESGCVLVGGKFAIHKQEITRQAQRLHELIRNWQQRNPEASGIDLATFEALMDTPMPVVVIEFLLGLLVTSGKLARTGTTWSLPGHKAQLSEVESKLWQKIESILRTAPEKPPVIHDLAKALSLDPEAVDRLLSRLGRLGFVVKPLSNRYFLPEGLAALEAAVTQLADQKGEFSVKDYRDLTGAGRNLCIEILEHFDRIGLTRRTGDMRTLNRRDAKT